MGDLNSGRYRQVVVSTGLTVHNNFLIFCKEKLKKLLRKAIYANPAKVCLLQTDVAIDPGSGGRRTGSR